MIRPPAALPVSDELLIRRSVLLKSPETKSGTSGVQDECSANRRQFRPGLFQRLIADQSPGARIPTVDLFTVNPQVPSYRELLNEGVMALRDHLANSVANAESVYLTLPPSILTHAHVTPRV